MFKLTLALGFGLVFATACNLSFEKPNGAGAGGNDACDVDNDGHDAIACGGNDCDDRNNSVFAGALELCDGHDNNCDGLVDEGGVCGNGLVDHDGDGYYGNDPNLNLRDCNDGEPSIHPFAAEFCDGVDNNCINGFDEGDVCAKPWIHHVFHYRPGLDVTKPVWVRANLSNAGYSDGQVECLMDLWTANGPNEVFECPFDFPLGAKVDFSVESLQDDNNSLFILDVCDYAGATMCEGKGSFCAVMYGGLNADMWVTRTSQDGPVVWNAGTIADRVAGAPKYVDNGDVLGICSADGTFVVGQ